MSFADEDTPHPLPTAVDHSSSIRRRWLRRDTRSSTASDSEDEPGPTIDGSPSAGRHGEAGVDETRHGAVEFIFRPVYKNVFRPIGKRVQLLVSAPEEPKARKKRFLSRRFVSAYGCVLGVYCVCIDCIVLHVWLGVYCMYGLVCIAKGHSNACTQGLGPVCALCWFSDGVLVCEHAGIQDAEMVRREAVVIDSSSGATLYFASCCVTK